ncbi:Acyl transferase/acyl hydrolase/lysophospholipase [Tylopilus felleus]
MISESNRVVVLQTAARQAYTPVTTACMDGFTLVRQAGLPGNQTLGCEELAYITGRKANILLNAWKTYLSHLQATNLTFPDYVTSILGGNNTSADYPSLGIACSGRGWRATMFGAGLLNVLDGRNQSSVTLGTGDLLQAASYITGLSGGSNLVGSLVQADFPTMEVLAFGTNSSDPTEAWGAWLTQTTQQTPYLNNTMNNKYLRGNYNAGYPVPFNDVTSRDNGYTWSGMASLSTITSYQQPFPILVATLLSPNANFSTVILNSSFIIPTSLSSIYVRSRQFTRAIFAQVKPCLDKMGSHDPTLAAFTLMKYLSTTNETLCVTNLDQIGTVVGASGDWNTYSNTSASALDSSFVYPIVSVLNATLPQRDIVLDLAVFPNAFQGPAMEEVVPTQPLFLKARGPDTTFAIDASNEYWSAGGSLVVKHTNISTLFPTAYSFPPVPTNVSEFVARNLSTRPTFFGCDSSTEAPLVIYVANGEPSNVSLPELQAILDQVYLIGTQAYPANASEATDQNGLPASHAQSSTARSDICATCLERYCWNGSTYRLETTTSTSGAHGGKLGRSGFGGSASVVSAILSCWDGVK